MVVVVVVAEVLVAAADCGGGQGHEYTAVVQGCCRCRFQLLPAVRTWNQSKGYSADAHRLIF